MSKKALFIGFGGVAFTGFLSLMAWGILNVEPATGRSGFVKVGKPAPEFIMSTFDGDLFVLREHLGQPIVINFWASWCVPCRVEAPELERTWRAYRDRGVMFVGVDIQDAERDPLAYIREFDITYPNGPDLDGKITVDYGVAGIPVTYFVDKDGIIARRFVGALPEPKLVAWIDELLADIAPSGDTEGANPEGYFELDDLGEER
jgi:cytochrome c biogenesis protein CcmG/thiol:disulfide interchange protein DsbE